MATLQSLDPHTPMFAQFKEKTGAIVLANTFFVPKESSLCRCTRAQPEAGCS